MKHWWVNQGQTFKEEIAGGYIWSPKANRNGSRNQSYLNLQEVDAGDLIFSYANGSIAAIGLAENRSVSSPKPTAHEKAGAQWAIDGWRVPVRWMALPHPIMPKDHLAQIVELLPKKYAPIRANGYGNQKFYLLAISDQLGSFLISLAHASNSQSVTFISEQSTAILDDLEEENIRRKAIPETEKDQIIKARRGQGVFRDNVEGLESECRLTRVSDKRFLIASHLKPWRACTNEERLDGCNGLLLSPHVDRLFDKGWISFSDDGKVLCSNRDVFQLMKAWGLDPARNVGPFSGEQAKYLHYHRTMVYGSRQNS